MGRKIRFVLALATMVLGIASTQNVITANEISENMAPPFEPGSDTSSRSRGGAFALEVRNVTTREASTGGTFRVVGSLQLKAAGDEVFSDDFETGDASMWSDVVGETDLPSGAVAFFELAECPPGWFHNDSFHRGRAIVGRMPGGAIGGVVGNQRNGQSGSHVHHMNFTAVIHSPSHNHNWSYLTAEPNPFWRTYSISGNYVTLIEWSDGIDGAGTGYYLFAAAAAQSFYTENAPAQSHTLTSTLSISGVLDPAPNVQFLICQKQ